METELRGVEIEERDHLEKVSEKLLPRDLPNPEELPRGVELVGHVIGWLFCVGFISMFPLLGILAILNQFMEYPTKTVDLFVEAYLVVAACFTIYMAVRVFRKHRRRGRLVDDYRDKLKHALKGRVAVQRLQVTAAQRLTTSAEKSLAADPVVLTVQGGSRICVPDPSRFDLTPVPCMDEIQGDLQRLNLDTMDENFPSSECTVFRVPDDGECLGILSRGDPLPPERMLATDIHGPLPADVGPFEPGKEPSAKDEAERAKRLEILRTSARRKRIMTVFGAFLLLLMMVGYGMRFLAWNQNLTIAAMNARISSGDLRGSFKVQGKIKGLPSQPSPFTHNNIQQRIMLIEDDTGTLNLKYSLRDFPQGFRMGQNVVVYLVYEEVKIIQGPKTGFLRATDISTQKP